MYAYGEYMWKIDSIEIKIIKKRALRYTLNTHCMYIGDTHPKKNKKNSHTHTEHERKEETYMHALNSPFGSFLMYTHEWNWNIIYTIHTHYVYPYRRQCAFSV